MHGTVYLINTAGKISRTNFHIYTYKAHELKLLEK